MKKYLILLLPIIILSSCKEDWFETNASDQIPAEKAFNTLKDGRNVINGIFSDFQDNNMYGADLIVYGDVKGTDVRTSDVGKRTENMYSFQETTDANTSTLWNWPYIALMNVNKLIAAKDKLQTDGTDEDEAYKNYIFANAYAIRALMHFELVRIYGRMPANGNPTTDLGIAILTEPIEKEAQLSRNTVAETYAQIFADLDMALSIYPASYAPTTGWFSDWSIKALYARTSLYYGDNTNALMYAEDIIINGRNSDDVAFSLIPASSYVSSFGTRFTSESILTLINTEDDNPSREGIGYLWSPAGYSAMRVTEEAITLLRSDANDVRQNLIGANGYLLKYPNQLNNNIDLFRLSEMFLIAAEAALKTSDNTKADDYIQALYRARTGDNTAVVTGVDLGRILLERRKELIGEGHRFYDLMRNGLPVVRTGTDHLLSAPMSIQPNDYRVIQPIPREELDVNQNIVQNPEYLN